jgi:hypothetical protein
MTEPLPANIIRWDHGSVTIRCPYCNNPHKHDKGDPGKKQRRAPGCGLYVNPDIRLAGYTFQAPARGE